MCKPRLGLHARPPALFMGPIYLFFPRMFIRYEKTLNKLNLKIGIHFANLR